MRRRRLSIAVAGCGLALALPASGGAFDPATEAKNFSKNNERLQHIVLTPEFQLLLQQQNTRAPVELAEINSSDPERQPLNICALRGNECAGDVRLYDWGSKHGIARPVLFTARSGATISGTVWGTRGGPDERPAIVITTGSVQAPETLYWGFAAVLAKHGYIVLTYDVQGQGRSDTFGAAPDQQEGVPSQAGQPFYDGTEDALDFILSTPRDPFRPRPSCGNANGGTPTSHAPKQNRRVAAGLNAAYNPLHHLIDPKRIGIAGHSLGAAGVSFVGQKDPRVDAIVAWDNLRAPSTATPPACPGAPATRVKPPITKPALGMSADYGIAPTPYDSDPARDAKNAAFAAYRGAGVDSGEVNIRGGCHEEFAFIPGNTFPQPLGCGTLRGYDMTAWYTVAWFDKYVKGIGSADRRLLTNRWCSDAPGAAIDPDGDGNLYSFYLDSPLNFERADGGRAVVADLRRECTRANSLLGPDGGAPTYYLIADAHRPDPASGGGGAGGGGGGARGCSGSPRRGTARGESLRGTGRGDRIFARGGADKVRSLGGDDCVRGNGGHDQLRGGAGADRLRGSSGDDLLVGGAGRDRIHGGPGSDRIAAAGGGIDRVICGRGRHDRARVDASDRVSGCETVRRT